LPEESLPVSERVYAALHEMILRRELEPNARLVELRLAALFGVSRTPVREALKRLSAEGLIVLDPQRGMVVRGIDATELAEINEIRGVLESFAARLAATRVTQRQLAQLRAATRRLRSSVESETWADAADASEAFTELLHEVAGSGTLHSMLRHLEETVRAYWVNRVHDREQCLAVVEAQERLLEALAAHAPRDAEAAAREYVAAELAAPVAGLPQRTSPKH
jgi:DNA-binding GntR family transcriptional regulator